MDFTSMEKYNGDMILINRLAEFFPSESWSWNKGEVVELNDISLAIHEAQLEESSPFGDTWKHLCMENKSTEWHIGRIIYFINHPEEIKDIEIDNICVDNYILPAPTIIDGNHRFMAAMWLNYKGKMDKVHCMYGGRIDVLDYLTGKSNEIPDE